MPDYIIGILYSIISILFIVNLGELIKKIKVGTVKINRLSLLATSALVFNFSALTLHFLYKNNWIVFYSQAYLLFTILYIRYISSQKDENSQ